jgi:hypothetical protein
LGFGFVFWGAVLVRANPTLRGVVRVETYVPLRAMGSPGPMVWPTLSLQSWMLEL